MEGLGRDWAAGIGRRAVMGTVIGGGANLGAQFGASSFGSGPNVDLDWEQVTHKAVMGAVTFVAMGGRDAFMVVTGGGAGGLGRLSKTRAAKKVPDKTEA